MSDMNYSLAINLVGNLQRKAQRYGQSLESMGSRGERSMRGYNSQLSLAQKNMTRGMSRMGGRLVGAALGGGIVVAGKSIADFDERLTRLGIDAKLNGEALRAWKEMVKKEAHEAAIAHGVEMNEIVSGLEKVIEKTGDLEFASKNVKNLAIGRAASNALGGDLGAMFSEFQKMNVKEPKKVLDLMSVIVQAGQEGAFVLRNFAGLGERIFSAYSPKNAQDVKAMAVTLQKIKDSTGSPDQAVTAFEALMRTFTDRKKIENLAKKGAIIFDHAWFEKTKEMKLLPLDEMIKNVVSATDGDIIQLSAMIEDSEARKGLTRFVNEYKETGKLASFDRLLKIDPNAGAILDDAADHARGLNAQLIRIKTVMNSKLDSAFSDDIQKLGESLQEIDADELERFFTVAKRGVGALAGFFIVSKVLGGVRDIAGGIGAMRGTTTGGVAGGLGGIGGSPLPVYVVNMNGGMSGDGSVIATGGGDGKADKKSQRKNTKKTARAGRMVRGVGRAAGRVAGPLAAVGIGSYQMYEAYTDKSLSTLDKVDKSIEAAGGIAGGIAGAKMGAAAGAAIGSFVPIIGAAAGAAVGGVVVGGLGYWGASSISDKFGDWVTAKDISDKNVQKKRDEYVTSKGPVQQKALVQLVVDDQRIYMKKAAGIGMDVETRVPLNTGKRMADI